LQPGSVFNNCVFHFKPWVTYCMGWVLERPECFV
jgi:hypothetical protein